MGKGKNRKKESDALGSSKRDSDASEASSLSAPPAAVPAVAASTPYQGIFWVWIVCILGAGVGFGLGSGFWGKEEQPDVWRLTLGGRVRDTALYQILSLKRKPWDLWGQKDEDTKDDLPIQQPVGSSIHSSTTSGENRAVVTADSSTLLSDPSHPTVFAVLREAIVREKGGFVHPDLGILQPAPSGAARGLGMVRDTWHQCQTGCFPGTRKERLAVKLNETAAPERYRQEEVLLKVPLSFQMTRKVALDTLLPRILPARRKASIHELDDAALLVLLLAHERGVGKYSRWLPYIASLPLEPSCGYSRELRPYILDSIQALKDELGLDVNGWSSEILKATQYAEHIASSLAQDYGNFLEHPKGMSAVDNIQWALCQVASRATAGSGNHGALRLVPMADMVNHDSSAGGFVELTGKEKIQEGTFDFVDATDEDSGTFVVRSLRHGRSKALKVGQELLVNYNVPHYSALDWFISLGFVPPERWIKWQKVDAALPRVRRDIIPGADRRSFAQ